MKVTSISYSRLKSVGSYEHEKAGVEISLDDDDDLEKSYNEAKKIVNTQLGIKTEEDLLREKYTKIIQNPDRHNYGDVIRAKEYLEKHYDLESDNKEDKSMEIDQDIPPF